MRKLWILPAALILSAIAIYQVDISAVKDAENEHAPEHAPEQGRETTHNTDKQPPLTPTPAQTDPRLTRFPDGRVHYNLAIKTSRAINATTSPQEALILVEQLFSHYRFAYKENPVGVENFEITEQLLGKNPKKIVFIAADSVALRGNELVDQWGTPYFFHALSGQEMDVRSAGPDQKLWTTDDVSLLQSDHDAARNVQKLDYNGMR